MFLRKHWVAVVLVVGWLGIASSLYPTGVFQSWEARGYDWLMRQRGVEHPGPRILLIDFDEESQARLGWPIPWHAIAQAIAAAAPHAELIGLDWLLSEHRSPAEEARLEQALAKAGNVVVASQLAWGDFPAAPPLKAFRQAAFDVGFANLRLERDGTVRRAYLFLREGQEWRESFALRLAANLLEAPLEVKATAKRHVHRLGKNLIHADADEPNAIWLRFYGPPSTFGRVLAWQVLEGAPEVSLAADIILIGQSNFAARDLHTTPFSPRLMAGMEVQATAVANLLTGDTIRRFPWFGMVLADLFTAGVVLVVFSLLRPLVAVLLSLGWVAGLVAAAVWALSVHNLWLPFAHTLVLAAGTATGAWGYRYAQERRARGQLMGFFERYVSPEVAREIWRQRDQITLAGERRTATVMFSDIRDFTQLTYQRPSTEVLEWLNEYFGIMVEVIQRHRGFLNKFLGDGLLAVFGVPVSRGEQGDARDAVAAALAMLAALEELNRKRSAAGMPPLRIGIGLHTGVLTAGTIGAADRSEYSVVGETVNLAARVETACRQLGRPLLLTEATRQLLGSQFVTQPAGTVALKGFGEPVPLYTVESPERLEGKA